MRKIISIAFFLFFANILFAQDFCSQGTTKKSIILPTSGLNLRAEPSLKSSILDLIPFQEEIWVCYSDGQPLIAIEDKTGRWLRAEYKGKEGWLFSAYLKIKDCSDEKYHLIVPNDGSVDFNPNRFPIDCKGYYGFFQKGKTEEFEIRLVNPIDTFSDYTLGTYGKMDPNDIPSFMITGLKYIPQGTKGRFVNEMLFPGEIKSIADDFDKTKPPKSRFYFYAKGNPIPSKDNQHLFEKIEGYQLRMRYTSKDNLINDYLLYENDLHPFGYGVYEGSARIFWYGDINGDDKLDFILRTSKHYAGWEYHMVLSVLNSGGIYEVLRVGKGSGC